MAISNIKGRDVALGVEKTAGSGVFTRVGCTVDLGFKITTESDEVTCGASTNFKEFEPGLMSIDASGTLNVRQLTDAAAVVGPPAIPAQTDATDGVSTENMLDYQLAGRKLKLRFTLGTGSGAARYEALFFVTSSDLKAQQKGIATYALSLQGTGAVTKTLTP